MSNDPTLDIRRILGTHAKLAVDAQTVDPEADLFLCGMSSHASVSVMLALEETFAVEFPDEMLTPTVFQSVSSLVAAISSLQVA